MRLPDIQIPWKGTKIDSLEDSPVVEIPEDGVRMTAFLGGPSQL